MIQVLYDSLPAGALSIYQLRPFWDREPILTLDHVTSEWVSASIWGDGRCMLQSGTTLDVPLPRASLTALAGDARRVAMIYDQMAGTIRRTLIELGQNVGSETGTMVVVSRGMMWGSFGARLNFGLGFTRGNAFEESFLPPTEYWCPRGIHPQPVPEVIPVRGKTIWERLLEVIGVESR